MNNFQFREYRRDDLPALKSLWIRVFGDPPALVDDFFRLLPGMGSCYIAEEDNSLLAMASVITGFRLSNPGRAPKRCAYLYAVAAEENARGRGLGSAVSKGAAELGRQAGAELLCTLPAEMSLYDWYRDILSLRHVTARTRYFSDILPDRELLTASEYGARREKMLSTKPHAGLDPAAMEFQSRLCAHCGGGLFATGESIFCALEDEGVWVIPEWLGPTSVLRSLPGFREETVPYLCSDSALPEGIVWNLSFD